MTARPVHVYKLTICYPEGSDAPGWEPACWGRAGPSGLEMLTSRRARRYRKWVRDRVFRWPRERLFLSSSSAYARAGLLRAYGAEVLVERSCPVGWPETSFTEDTETYCHSSGSWIAYDASGIPLDLPGIIICDSKAPELAGITWAATGPGKHDQTAPRLQEKTMFYCPDCASKNRWPETMSRSTGPCEVCGRNGPCYDMPSEYLPLPPSEKAPS